MKNTALISNIEFDYKESYLNKCFLTFDIDWAPDFVLEEILNILDRFNIKGTFFATHETNMNQIIKGKGHELGAHPNFNPLLLNKQETQTAESILDNILKIDSDITSIRSHSTTQSSVLLKLFLEKNIFYECNDFIPFESGIVLKPFSVWGGKMCKVPYFWEDDISFFQDNRSSIKQLLLYEGLKVFDFHPIHIYLNSSSMKQYETIKTDMKNQELVNKGINHQEFGVKDFFINLLETIS